MSLQGCLHDIKADMLWHINATSTTHTHTHRPHNMCISSCILLLAHVSICLFSGADNSADGDNMTLLLLQLICDLTVN